MLNANAWAAQMQFRRWSSSLTSRRRSVFLFGEKRSWWNSRKHVHSASPKPKRPVMSALGLVVVGSAPPAT